MSNSSASPLATVTLDARVVDGLRGRFQLKTSRQWRGYRIAPATGARLALLSIVPAGAGRVTVAVDAISEKWARRRSSEASRYRAALLYLAQRLVGIAQLRSEQQSAALRAALEKASVHIEDVMPGPAARPLPDTASGVRTLIPGGLPSLGKHSR